MSVKKLLLFIFIITASIASSQNYLGISKVITGFRDTVNINQSVSYKVYIKNYGPSIFSGHFRLNTWADSSGTINDFHFSRLDTLFNPVTIAVGDSILFNTGDTYDLSTYRVTGNVVVIWPKTFNPGWETLDSVFHNVYVRGLTQDINEYNELEKSILLHPNPVLSELYLKFNNKDIRIEEVRILDQISKYSTQLNTLTNSINVSYLASGFYLIDIKTNKGTIYKRFLKE